MFRPRQPVVAEGAPVLEPLQIGVGLAEELQLHLLELAGAEDEVARGDLVAEGLADLADAEGQLAPGGALDVGKFTKMPWAVSGRRYTVFFASSVTPWKVLNIRLNWRMSVKLCLPQLGQGTLLVLDVGHHLLVAHGLHIDVGDVVFVVVALDELVRPVRILQLLQSMSGSLKVFTWPEATHTSGFIKMAESRPTL
jgi:hypothetical protein